MQIWNFPPFGDLLLATNFEVAVKRCPGLRSFRFDD